MNMIMNSTTARSKAYGCDRGVLQAMKQTSCRKREESAQRRIVSTWRGIELLASSALCSGDIVDAADLIPSDTPQSFLCRRGFSEVKRYLRLSNQANSLSSNICQKLELVYSA